MTTLKENGINYIERNKRIGRRWMVISIIMLPIIGYLIAPYLSTTNDILATLFILWCTSTFIFRQRLYGRVMIASDRCMERPFSLATGITICLSTGILKYTQGPSTPILFVIFISITLGIGIFFLYIALREGPVYGWHNA